MDMLLFGVFPYVAFTIFVVGTIVRYRMKFKFSSLSAQFLETRNMFLCSVPFHVSLLLILLGHLIGFLFPSLFLGMGGSGLVVFEVIALGLGFTAIVGLVTLLIRRLVPDRLKAVTTKMDITIELLLIGQ